MKIYLKSMTMIKYENDKLIAQLSHSYLENGKVVFKINDVWFIGNLSEISINMKEGDLTTFNLYGFINYK